MRFDWDNNDYDAPTDFELIPEGTEVRMVCEEAEDKECRGGMMVSCTFKVVSGEYKGRKIWCNFIVEHSSEKAQNFGRRMISGWARSCNKPNARSTDELLEKPFSCKLGVEKNSDPKYKDKNVIASFLMPEGTSSPAPNAVKSAPVSAPAEEEAPAPKKEAPKLAAAPAAGKKNPWDD